MTARSEAAAFGLVVVDKPEGPTSFDVVAAGRRALGTRAIGHTGTLDPLASGVLVLLVGRWTRLASVLEADDKRYTATVAFGTATATDDREGEVVARGDPSGITREALERALVAMTGAQQQMPPAYSAIHVDGERAYARARRGEAVALQPRHVTLHTLALTAWDPPRAVIDVRCSKGTYVRAFARDLGLRLGVPAHLGALRRTAAGPWTLEDAVALAELGPDALRRGTAALRGVNLVPVSADDAQALRQGKRVPVGDRTAGTAVAHLEDEPVAIVSVDAGVARVLRGFG